MVTFSETTQVSPMELHKPACLATTLSPGLRRKKMLWQNAVKHIIIQQELSAQVTPSSTHTRSLAYTLKSLSTHVRIELELGISCKMAVGGGT